MTKKPILRILFLLVITACIFITAASASENQLLAKAADVYRFFYDANGTGVSNMPSPVYGIYIPQYFTLSNQVPSRANYTFQGWSPNKNSGSPLYRPGHTIYISAGGPFEVYAIWSGGGGGGGGGGGTTYTLTYDANGGSGAPGQQSAAANCDITLSNSRPVRDGHSFLGWSANKSATTAQYQPGDKFNIGTDNKTLYAVWSVNTYRLTYNANGGSGAPGQQSATANSIIYLSNIKPERENHTFLGWSTNRNATTAQYQPGDPFNIGTDNKTLFAVWRFGAWTDGGVKNAYINNSATAQNGSADNYQLVERNNTITYELKYEKWSPAPLATVPNPVFQAKAPMPGKVNFINGSFEQPAMNVSLTFFPQAQVPGWSTRPSKSADNSNPGAYIIEIQSIKYNDPQQNQFAPHTPDGGSQYVELNAHVEGTLYQICDTVPGAKIYYEFYHGARMWRPAPTANTDVMNFYLRAQGAASGGLQRVCTDSAVRGTQYKWGHYTGTYTIPAGQTKTEFSFESVSSTSGDKSVGNYLDGIRLYSNSYIDLAKTNNAPSGKADTGDVITYTIVAQNKGESDASAVRILDVLPAGTELVANTVRIDNVLTGNFSYDPNTRQVGINVGAGASAAAGGLIRGDGSFSADCNNSYTITFQIRVTGAVIAQNQKYESQSRVTYEDRYDSAREQYTNYSNINEFSLEQRVTSAVITDAFPAGLTYLSHTAPNGAVFQRIGQTCTWTWQELPANDVVVTVTVTVAQGTEKDFVNRATLTVGGSEINTNYTYHKVHDTRTITGFVWPMVANDRGLGESFLRKHDVVVELRPTFRTPAAAELSTKAILVNDSGRGQFTLENVPFGVYVLYIKRPGYLARAMMVTVSASDPPVMELAPLSAADNGTFKLWWGDCNGNGRVDTEDMLMIMELMTLKVDALNPLYDPACDLNGDRLIDNEDMLMVLDMWNKIVSDYPGTGGVDFFK